LPIQRNVAAEFAQSVALKTDRHRLTLRGHHAIRVVIGSRIDASSFSGLSILPLLGAISAEEGDG